MVYSQVTMLRLEDLPSNLRVHDPSSTVEHSDDQLSADQIDRMLSATTQPQAMYSKCKLVHADLSEYNILYWGRKIQVIDLGQAVEITHPSAADFLLRARLLP